MRVHLRPSLSVSVHPWELLTFTLRTHLPSFNPQPSSFLKPQCSWWGIGQGVSQSWNFHTLLPNGLIICNYVPCLISTYFIWVVFSCGPTICLFARGWSCHQLSLTHPWLGSPIAYWQNAGRDQHQISSPWPITPKKLFSFHVSTLSRSKIQTLNSLTILQKVTFCTF